MTSTRITIVGEAFGQREEALGRPFVGPGGHVLDGLLSQAGISREECAITNVFNFRPRNNDIETLCVSDKRKGIPGYPFIKRGKYISAEHAPHIAALWRFLERHDPNIIIALGGVALWALTKQLGIAKWRGSPLLTHDERWKVLTTWHPSAVLRQWELRPVAFVDLCKAQRESASPRLVRPRRIIHLEPTLADIESFYRKYIVPAEFVACDIETKGNTITEVGFATSPSRAIVIPFWSRAARDGNYWPDAEAERAAWEWVRRILAEKPTIGQNFQYDMQYLYRTLGIASPQFAGDTMILHHTLQPEMKKSLGFLGSVYTDEPSWKFMRTDHSTIKQEDE